MEDYVGDCTVREGRVKVCRVSVVSVGACTIMAGHVKGCGVR